jgi:hypothetical protein
MGMALATLGMIWRVLTGNGAGCNTVVFCTVMMIPGGRQAWRKYVVLRHRYLQRMPLRMSASKSSTSFREVSMIDLEGS